jgi:hypothetical protein
MTLTGSNFTREEIYRKEIYLRSLNAFCGWLESIAVGVGEKLS